MVKKEKLKTFAGRQKRSRAEGSTGAKEAAAEVRKVSASAPELDLPKPDVLKYHRAQLKGYQEKLTTAQANYRNAMRAAKAAGVDTDAHKEAESIRRENDPAKTRRYFEQLAMMLQAEGSPIAITIHDVASGSLEEEAYRLGVADGEKGHANNRYPEGTTAHAAYARGYSHVQGARIGLTEEQTDGAIGAATPKEDRALAEALMH
jgi:hypothetical protein